MDRDTSAIYALARADLPCRLRSRRLVSICRVGSRLDGSGSRRECHRRHRLAGGVSDPVRYFANFANYDATYGSLGAAIGMMIWMWMSSIVILVGAELNSEIEHQTAQDFTTGHEKPIGQRGAAMADTVGKEAG